MSKKRLGFLGGTFNPVHYGHLRLAEEARLQYNLDEVLFIPNRIPPHRQTALADLPDSGRRYTMTLLAVLSNPFFSASDIELKREGPSYTYDTALELKNKFPGHELFLIAGADILIRCEWHRLEELSNLLEGFLLAPRGADSIQEAARRRPFLSPKLHEIRMEPVEISSTEIRRRLSGGGRIKYMLPEIVEQYIERCRLYREARVP